MYRNALALIFAAALSLIGVAQAATVAANTPITLSSAMLFENGRPGLSSTTVGSVTYARGGNGARWKWTTDARRMWISSYAEYSSAFTNNGRTGLLVDGVPYFFGAPQATGVFSQLVRLPPGASKTVELFVPLQFAASAGATPAGVFPYQVTFDAAATEISPTLQATHLVIYSDSIGSGGVAIAPSVWGYAGLAKRASGGFGGSVTQVAWGTRRLADDCATAPACTTFVTGLLALSPTKILLAIGSNDHSVIPAITLANFTTYYGRLLDEIHSQSPTMPIVCLSPIRRGTEAANGNGETLAQFRTAISNAVTARSGWAVPPSYIDGLAIFADTTQLPDLVHPGTTGNQTMWNYIGPLLLLEDLVPEWLRNDVAANDPQYGLRAAA